VTPVDVTPVDGAHSLFVTFQPNASSDRHGPKKLNCSALQALSFDIKRVTKMSIGDFNFNLTVDGPDRFY